MSSHSRIESCLLGFALILLHPTHAAGAFVNSFRICAEPNNLPMSDEGTRSGFEIEVAELVAKELGQPLEVKWVAQRDPSYLRQTIGAGACDAIMGIPADF